MHLIAALDNVCSLLSENVGRHHRVTTGAERNDRRINDPEPLNALNPEIGPNDVSTSRAVPRSHLGRRDTVSTLNVVTVRRFMMLRQ